MSVTAAINLPANATRSAGESFAAAFTICSTINATFLQKIYRHGRFEELEETDT